MKKSRPYILALFILGCALLFNQVGINFFHDSHEAHQYFSASQKGQSMLLNHGEHCQVCSLEVLFNVVLPASTEVPTQQFVSDFVVQGFPEPVFIFLGLSRGRAPPTVA